MGRDMETKKGTVGVKELEELLKRLPGVLSARMVINNWGAIEEIHVLATTERHPKQIVRDVESSLAAKFGIALDHKKISIAQLTDTEKTLPDVRLKLENVKVSADTSRSRYDIEISLLSNMDPDDRFIGRMMGPAARSQTVRLAGMATLDAINQATNSQVNFALEDVRSVEMGSRRLMVALVLLVNADGEEEVLVGGAVVKGDPLDAAVKACLDASNRRIGMLYQRPKRERRTDINGKAEVSEEDIS